MRYVSTRDASKEITAAQAIAQGLSRDGGLFSPCIMPELSLDSIMDLCVCSYKDRAVSIMKLFLDDFSESELREFSSSAYNEIGFDHPDIAPLRKLEEGLTFLELWHGPTSAFKDMALQMLPYLLTASLKKTGEKKQAAILVATSGDTGKAALEGFKDVSGTKILVFYPRDGVSDVQKLQMTTQEGNNVGVCAVSGNFDDAQNGVKEIFSDEALRNELEQKGFFLSSANSINWGRLLPQIVYYFSAYCDLINSGDIKAGDNINFCVPTGNFGNILAGFFAMKMGLPINKLICASNANNVLTDFFETGEYNKDRSLLTTISPSMDILISSNLERLLFELSDCDDKLISDYMVSLTKTGKYKINDELKASLDKIFAAGFCDDESTMQEIGNMYSTHGYLIDTHTAVAYNVLNKYREKSGDMTHCVIISTASPYKFCDSVLSALGYDIGEKSGLELVDELSQKTGTHIPKGLSELKSKLNRFELITEKEDMKEVVRNILEIN